MRCCRRLDLSEIQALARDLQPDLSSEEVKEAFKVLDADNSRFIELPGGFHALPPPAFELACIVQLVLRTSSCVMRDDTPAH